MKKRFTLKWIIGSFCVVIVFGIACYFYYQPKLLPYKPQAVETEEMKQRAIVPQKAETAREVEQAVSDAPVESGTPTPEPLVPETTVETENTETTPAIVETESPTETTEPEDVLVSPHGFGPYPKLPPDYPGAEDPKFWTYDWDKNDELMIRVSVKLWKQGKRTHGESMSDGLVYPVYPNTLIVKWKTKVTPFGTRRQAVRIKGSPETEAFQQAHRGSIYEDNIPSHFTVLEWEDAGIDPYEFLDLPK